MKLIVGLGNPGREYQHSRHNVGFMCLSRFAHDQGIAFSRAEAKSRVGSGIVAGVEVVLARPHTYMNLSGDAVARLLRRYRAGPGDLVVVHDDLDLPLGAIRIRVRGSSGGHKGVTSIIAAVGTQEFIRIRVGIGRPPDSDAVDYVLGSFSPDEKAAVDAVAERVSHALLSIITEGAEAAMDRFNRSAQRTPGTERLTPGAGTSAPGPE